MKLSLCYTQYFVSKISFQAVKTRLDFPIFMPLAIWGRHYQKSKLRRLQLYFLLSKVVFRNTHLVANAYFDPDILLRIILLRFNLTRYYSNKLHAKIAPRKMKRREEGIE